MTGCSPEPSGQSMVSSADAAAIVSAGPYDIDASDATLRACSQTLRLATAIGDEEITLGNEEDNATFTYTLLEAKAQALYAATLTARYGMLYDAFRVVDDYLVRDDFISAQDNLGGILNACSGITAADSEELSNRGIVIEPGAVPNLVQ